MTGRQPGKRRGKTTGWIHRTALKNHGVKLLTGLECEKIEDGVRLAAEI